jgi:hypothetical protein
MRKRGSSSHMAKRYGNKLSTLVHNRIIDLMFPGLVLGEEIRAKQEEKISKRKAASQKVKNWRAGLRWSTVSTGESCYYYQQIYSTRSK